MRLPIKLSDARWPRALRRIVGENLRRDPRILLDPAGATEPAALSEAISSFKIGTTFKTTSPERHPQSDALVAPYCDAETVILDIGASDGVTALDLIARLGPAFRRYYVTDYNLEVRWLRAGRRCFFFHPDGACVLVAGPWFVAYPAESKRVRRLYGRALRRLAPRVEGAPTLQLIHPRLARLARESDRVRIARHDVFEPWKGERPGLIKVANVLNLHYFSAERIRGAIARLRDALPDAGLLLVVENRPAEQAGLYRRRGARFERLGQVGPGADIDGLILG